LIEDADLRATMGRAARDHYEAHFTFDRLVRETLETYDTVLAQP
jgi:hypothetical protein